MPKRSRKPRDFVIRARQIVEQAIGERLDGSPLEQASTKNENAVALGRLGGKKGGNARAKKLSPERRKEIASKAGKASWQD